MYYLLLITYIYVSIYLCIYVSMYYICYIYISICAVLCTYAYVQYSVHRLKVLPLAYGTTFKGYTFKGITFSLWCYLSKVIPLKV